MLGHVKPGLFEGDYLNAIAYIQSNLNITEVIFSGGDPLMVNDTLLSSVLKRLERISHIQSLRFHTRVPVTLPSRLDRNLVRVLSRIAHPCRLVTHFNHPKEITPESTKACSLLLHGNIQVMNQSVLLRGVNDSPDTLAKLWKNLHAIGVQNYYLHHPDRAYGTHHFTISMEEGLAIYSSAKSLLPTSQVPRYVVDLGNSESKTDVSSIAQNSGKIIYGA